VKIKLVLICIAFCNCASVIALPQGGKRTSGQPQAGLSVTRSTARPASAQPQRQRIVILKLESNIDGT